jgi:hypothetical protein
VNILKFRTLNFFFYFRILKIMKFYEILWKLKFLKYFENFEILGKFWNFRNLLKISEFPVCHFRCKEFKPLVIWIWNQNIAISTIVGTSFHIKFNRFNPATLLCLYRTRTWIATVICRDLFCVQWVQLRWEAIARFVDIGVYINYKFFTFTGQSPWIKYEKYNKNVDIKFSVHDAFLE